MSINVVENRTASVRCGSWVSYEFANVNTAQNLINLVKSHCLFVFCKSIKWKCTSLNLWQKYIFSFPFSKQKIRHTLKLNRPKKVSRIAILCLSLYEFNGVTRVGGIAMDTNLGSHTKNKNVTNNFILAPLDNRFPLPPSLPPLYEL